MVSNTSRNGGAVMIGLNRRRTMGASKQDYIQDGLVFHLDCADYDATLNTWVDKKGNVSFAMSNVAVDALGGVDFNGTNSKGETGSSLVFGVDTSTIEVALNVKSSRTQIVFGNNKNFTICYGFLSNTGRALCSTGITKKYASTHKTTGLLIQSVHYGDNPINVVDGNIDVFDSGGTYWSNYGGSSKIGCRSNNTNFFEGTIYQIRIYNRLLTADEMIHNQQIDMQKYNS